MKIENPIESLTLFSIIDPVDGFCIATLADILVPLLLT